VEYQLIDRKVQKTLEERRNIEYHLKVPYAIMIEFVFEQAELRSWRMVREAACHVKRHYGQPTGKLMARLARQAPFKQDVKAVQQTIVIDLSFVRRHDSKI
jgi:hypothetical protein